MLYTICCVVGLSLVAADHAAGIHDEVCASQVGTRSVHASWPKSQCTQEPTNTAGNIKQQFNATEYFLERSRIHVPVYDIRNPHFDSQDPQTQRDIYDNFFNAAGALIVRGAYSEDTMDAYNKWCEDFLETAKNDANCRHPKQAKKYLINDVIPRMGQTDADLLLKLINNKYFTMFTDIVLGFMKFGAVTTHWIEAGGDRQMSHVDYPMHVGSGPFWESDVEKLKQLTTSYQLNHILPYYSVQVLVASDRMNNSNGATELVAGSHLIPDIDILVHDDEVYAQLEPWFESVNLQQGDFLIFNRRLVHRGGRNLSDRRRNSLIMQCVWLWGTGQEIIPYDEVLGYLQECDEYNALSEQEKVIFLTRLRAPYPSDTKLKT